MTLYKKLLICSLVFAAASSGVLLWAYQEAVLEFTGGFGMSALSDEPLMYAGLTAIIPSGLWSKLITLESITLTDDSSIYVLRDAWIWEQPYVKNVSPQFTLDKTVKPVYGYKVGKASTIEGAVWPHRVGFVFELERTGAPAEAGLTAGPFRIDLIYSILGVRRSASTVCGGG